MPLLLGAGAGLIGALFLAPVAGSALGELASARAEWDSLRTEADAPMIRQSLLAPGLALRAGDAAMARTLAAARVQALAKAGGLLVEDSGALKAPAGVVALRLRVSGAEKAVFGFVDALEREKSVLRLRDWQIEALPGGSVRLSGELVAGWR